MVKLRYDVNVWYESGGALKLQQGEVGGRVVEFQIADEHRRIDLTGKKVYLSVASEGGSDIQVECEVADPLEGLCLFEPTGEFVENDGEFVAYLHIVGEETILTSRQFGIEVVETVVEFEPIVEDDEGDEPGED